MSALDDLQSGYTRVRNAERKVTDLAIASANLIAAVETELTQCRQDLDALAVTLGYKEPNRLKHTAPQNYELPHEGEPR